ncbi:sigma-70 family RNA polymerase sigma factor [Paenibacillus sp. LMG 31457]|uniref:Sigma-70 family RNA polymerase sigma factor n=2 Tax=Paenibacillus planticolens TaxID=2654976 RepID=A0ABX1ZST6_9BACL|nr:sigma-70 family RNA polymerase sigma factor [Paenibacillus planticolens]
MEEYYRTYKKLLFSVAYRMLGSVSDSEDILQEMFISLQTMDTEHITNMKSYLVKMVTNRCLNELKSARKQRELYIGPWLPEPQVHEIGHNPLDRLEQEETVNYAFLVLLQKLSAMERAVFVLREVLGYEYGEVAEMLQKTEHNCRKIYSRAKLKIGSGGEAPAQLTGDTEPLAQLYLRAVNTGDFKNFVSMLTNDAVLVSDGGGKKRAALKPIFGKERIQAFLEGIAAKGALQGDWRLLDINGQTGLVLIQERKPVKIISFHWYAGQQQALEVYLIVNPDKLEKLESFL